MTPGPAECAKRLNTAAPCLGVAVLDRRSLNYSDTADSRFSGSAPSAEAALDSTIPAPSQHQEKLQILTNVSDETPYFEILRPVGRSVARLVTRSLGRSLGRSLDHSVAFRASDRASDQATDRKSNRPPADCLPISCPMPADILPTCLPISCPMPAEILPTCLPISCPMPADIPPTCLSFSNWGRP